ncbi:MAG: ABC transporter permease [Defluviitaleaceae bacterium]|nr:ABC transporter permease [Defluviitaleaceae bacterium]
MTKKHFAVISFVLAVLFSILFWFYLPMQVAGLRPGNIFMQLFYVGFIAATVSMIFVFALVWIIKREYVKRQIDTLKHFRYLIYFMVKRDFVTRYRRSVLGVLWSLLNPLLNMIVLSMVFSFLFEPDINNFPVYVFSGQLIFNFFSESTSNAMMSIVGNAGTIKKLYVPKYIFPITRVLSSTVNLGFSFIAFLLVFVATGESFKWAMLLIPIPVLYVFVFALGAGMILSALAVFFRDITYVYTVGLTMLMFLTPILYPVAILPARVFHLVHLNPLFHYVGYFRALVLEGTVPGLWENIICLGFALAALGVGLYVKMAQQDKYILYI